MAEFKAEMFEELSILVTGEGKNGPMVCKAQIIKYGEGRPGLNIQNFFTGVDGSMRFGKRPLLTLDLLKWIKEEDLIDRAIEALEQITKED